jgi:hypothetical protein
VCDWIARNCRRGGSAKEFFEPRSRKGAKFKSFYPQITQISRIMNFLAARLSAAEGGSIQKSALICG